MIELSISKNSALTPTLTFFKGVCEDYQKHVVKFWMLVDWNSDKFRSFMQKPVSSCPSLVSIVDDYGRDNLRVHPKPILNNHPNISEIRNP